MLAGRGRTPFFEAHLGVIISVAPDIGTYTDVVFSFIEIKTATVIGYCLRDKKIFHRKLLSSLLYNFHLSEVIDKLGKSEAE